METNDCNEKPRFAITARSLGHPRKLYTPLTVINLDRQIAARVNAMWDTGAEMCIISHRLALQLQLSFSQSIKMQGAVDSVDAPVGIVSLAIVGEGGIIPVYAAVSDGYVGGNDYSMILGMNFIRLGTLAVTSTQNSTMLSFKIPSGAEIDFTALVDAATPTGKFTLSDGIERPQFYQGAEAARLLMDALPDPS